MQVSGDLSELTPAVIAEIFAGIELLTGVPSDQMRLVSLAAGSAVLLVEVYQHADPGAGIDVVANLNGYSLAQLSVVLGVDVAAFPVQVFPGCVRLDATNFDSSATIDDGSCDSPQPTTPAPPPSSSPPPLVSPVPPPTPPSPFFESESTLRGASPTGAAIETPTNVTLHGSFLGHLGSRRAALSCVFYPNATGAPILEVGVAAITASAVVCEQLVPPLVASAVVVELRAGGEVLPATGTFVWYDAAAATPSAVEPAGVPEGLEGRELLVRGAGFADHGGVSCRFGGVAVVPAVLESGADVRCALPLLRLPSGVGAYTVSVEVSANNVTFAPVAATLVLYTAEVSECKPSALPATSATPVTLTGAGFVDLGVGVARCFYTRSDGGPGAEPFARPATIVDSSTAECLQIQPEEAVSGASYHVQLSLNGDGRDLVFDVFQRARMYLYDIGSVRLDGVDPAGGPVGGGTRITLSGAGFGGALASDGLCCVLDGACAAPASLLLSSAGSSTVRAACALPAASSEGVHSIELSVGGVSGMTTNAGLQFVYYAPPRVQWISPNKGDPRGGNAVTVSGGGFGGLLNATNRTHNASDASTALRVRFGAVPAPPPVRVSDDAIVVLSPFGAPKSSAVVTVALNGQQYGAPSPASAPNTTFSYLEGLHAPALLSVVFGAEATTLIFQLDEQPTDRAGMSGVRPCAVVLDDATVARIQGGASSAPGCYWEDDSTLVAQLNSQTTVAPGDELGLRGDVLRPRLSAIPCPDELCATATEQRIPLEPAVACAGGCLTPVARIVGPTSISACPDQRLRLSSAGSTGGGVAALRYAWALDATVGLTPEAATTLSAEVAAATAPTLDLLLPPGSRYIFKLRVTSFLGLSSEIAAFEVVRSSGLEPMLTVEGPAQVRVRPDVRNVVRASVRLAACWPIGERSSAVQFSWRAISASPNNASLPDPAVPLTIFGDTEPQLATLELEPSALRAKYTYTLEATATMAVEPSAVASARVQLVVESQPVRALIAPRTQVVSVTATRAVIDGSSSTDPNVGRGEELTYSWAVERAGASPSAPSTPIDAARGGVAVNRSTLTLPLTALAGVGEYSAVLVVAAADGRTSSTRAWLTVVNDYVPELLVPPLSKAKYNTVWTTPTEAVGLTVGLESSAVRVQAVGNISYTYRWSATELIGGQTVPTSLDLADANTVTTTGIRKPTFVFRSGVPLPGATYVLKLDVSGGAETASVDVTVLMNRPPHGGVLLAEPSELRYLQAAALSALEWADDPDDLPLRYRFGYQATDRVGASVEQYVTRRTLEAQTSAVLPVGARVCTLNVYDQFDGVSRATASVLVLPPEPADTSANATRGVIGEAQRAVDTEDLDLALQLVVALADASVADITAVDSNEGREVVRELLAITASVAVKRSSDSDGSEAQLTGAIATVLAATGGVEPSAQAEGLDQITAVLERSRDAAVGVDDTTASNSLGGIESTLLGSSGADVELEPVTVTTVDTAIDRVVTTLAGGLLEGILPGEAAREAVGVRVAIRSLRAFANTLPNSTLDGPGGSGAISLPSAVLAGVDPAATESGVDVQLVRLQRNIHADPRGSPSNLDAVDAALVPDAAAEGTYRLGEQRALQSAIFGVRLLPAAQREPFRIVGLVEPVEIAVPLLELSKLPTLGDPAADVDSLDTCASGALCAPPGDSERGRCNASAGVCECSPAFAGATCDELVLCHFWNATSEAWSADGCTTGTRTDRPGALVCACDHLTDFAALAVAIETLTSGDGGGVQVNTPVDAEELEADLGGSAPADQVVLALGARLEANYWGVVVLALMLGLFGALGAVAYHIDVALETRPVVPVWQRRAKTSLAWRVCANILRRSTLTSWLTRLPGEPISAKQRVAVLFNVTLMELFVVALYLGRSSDSNATQLVLAVAIGLVAGFPYEVLLLENLWLWASRRRGLFEERRGQARDEAALQRALRVGGGAPPSPLYALPVGVPANGGGSSSLRHPSAVTGGSLHREPLARSTVVSTRTRRTSMTSTAAQDEDVGKGGKLGRLRYVRPDLVRVIDPAPAPAPAQLQMVPPQPAGGFTSGDSMASEDELAVEMPEQALIAITLEAGQLVGFLVACEVWQRHTTASGGADPEQPQQTDFYYPPGGGRLGLQGEPGHNARSVLQSLATRPAELLSPTTPVGTQLLPLHSHVRFVQAELVRRAPPLAREEVETVYGAAPRARGGPRIKMVCVTYTVSPYTHGTRVQPAHVVAAPDVAAREALKSLQCAREQDDAHVTTRASSAAPSSSGRSSARAAAAVARHELMHGAAGGRQRQVLARVRLTRHELEEATWWANKPKRWKRQLVWGINIALMTSLSTLLLAFSLLGSAGAGGVRDPAQWREAILGAWALETLFKIGLIEPLIVMIQVTLEYTVRHYLPEPWRDWLLEVFVEPFLHQLRRPARILGDLCGMCSVISVPQQT